LPLQQDTPTSKGTTWHPHFVVAARSVLYMNAEFGTSEL
jgi:hypothetical protein